MGPTFLLLLAVAGPDAHCAALAGLKPPGVTVLAAEPVSGRFAAPDGAAVEVVPACRVSGIAAPAPGSRIGFEIWLPRQGWNGRYVQLGSGGFGGNVHYPSLAAEAARGNAVGASDSGHRANAFDARWAARNKAAVEDYGYRSIKATSDAAASLIAGYYGRKPSWRYFAGCSNGGRQALMAAQRYPDDWDGILAGAPPARWTHQLETFAALQHGLRSARGGWIPPQLLPAIQRAALAACPAGSVKAGVALAPLSCRLDPRRLLCRGAGRADCLTAAQIGSLRRIVAAGYQPTSAASPDGWAQWIVNPDPAAPSQRAFALQAQRFLFADRAALWLRRTLDADALDFTRFRARGGRILSYFGWADPLISPRDGADYYRRVAARNGGGPTRDFYRLFMVPGMTHCQGGIGPVNFGQSLTAPAARPDPAHDVRRALEDWVEHGVAPEALIAADPATSAERRLSPL
ncbi:MAG: hypothetical protein QOH81_1364 [Sphingomonadales bacterium]|jgi:feruloyl esterase|nr:hypothetical protein [Sphingomonadales bacterium]